MATIIFTQQQFNIGASSGSSGEGLANSGTLSRLSADANGNLLFNGKIVGEKSVEVSYDVTLSEQNITQKSIALPYDCDTSRNILLYFNGIALKRGDFWEVSEKDFPQKDLIAWNGLQLENIIQAGDSVCITYYKII